MGTGKALCPSSYSDGWFFSLETALALIEAEPLNHFSQAEPGEQGKQGFLF
jgi:hypothetical protein